MKTGLEAMHLNSLTAMKFISPTRIAISALITGLTLLGNLPSSQAASASWNPLPTNNNWIAAPTTNNWSTGVGTFPGATSGTSSSDIATFNTNSSITTVNCASAFVIGGIVFDTTNAAAYTINTSGGTWRVVGSGIRVTGTVTNKQTINGTLRMASSSTLYVVSDASISSATLNINGGISVNNSGTSGTLILAGTNTGPNILGAYTEQTPASILGNLIKTNTGTWILTGNNTYHSNTFILGGTLELMGSGAIPNSTNMIVNGGALVISNIFSNPNNMWLTNSGLLALTNTAVTQTPLTIGTLTASNATIQLGVNGASPYTDISVSTALNAGPNITLAIVKVVGLVNPTTFTLISYAGTDPAPADFTVTVPSGYTASALTVGGGSISVTITPPVSTALVWVGETNSVLVSNWDTNKTMNWVDQATLSFPQVYLNPDAVSFDDTAATNRVTVLTTNTPNNVTVNNNNLNYVFTGPGKISGFTSLTKGGGASLTLADNGDDFSGGIAINGGTLILDNTNGNISGGLTVSGGTMVQIGNNDANGTLPSGTEDDEGTLVFQRANTYTMAAPISGGGTVIQNGTGQLTLTTTNTYNGITIASLGTLALTGGGAISNSPGLLVSNATFDVSGIVGTTLLNDFSLTNATLNLSATNLLTPIITSTFEVDGIIAHSNRINVLTLPVVANYPVTIPLIQSANPITLANNGNFNLILGSLPAGYVGGLSESSDGTTVLLMLSSGPTGTRSFVTWVGVDNATVTTNWSDAANWQLPGAPGPADNVFFSAGNTTVTSETTVNNFVDQNFTIASLTYDQTASGQWHVTQIPAGNTLTVSGATVVGGASATDGVKTYAAMVDAGTLVLSSKLTIGNNGNTSPDTGTILDLSGLSNFVYNASGSTITLGTGSRSAGNLNLAGVSNSITVGTINANTASGSSSCSGTMNLGAGTNVLNIGTFNIAAERSSCTVQFPSGVSAAGLRLRGSAGTDASRGVMTVGNRNASGSSGTTTGTLSLNGNQVDMKLSTLTVGVSSAVTPNIGTGTLAFDTGIIDVSNLLLAVNSSTGTANGGVTVGAGATLVVGTGGISLVNQTSTGAATGSLTISGGTVICSNSILKTTSSGSIANVTLTDGALNLISGTLGSLPLPIDNLTLNGGTIVQLSVVAGVTNMAVNTVSASGTTTLNIASFAGLIGSTQVPLIHYGSGDPWANLILGTVPAGYVVGNGGALVDNQANQSIDIIVTPPAPIIWSGAVSSSWDTTTFNWLNGLIPAIYADGDYVQFDDTASDFIVSLAATVSPAGLAVTNNTHNYTFNGSGNITSVSSLVKAGGGTLILDNSGTYNFSAGVNILGGTLQLGNNDANGALPASAAILDNGNLAFDRTDSNAIPNVISGSGTVSQTGTGTNRLVAINTYTGNTVISAGMLIVTNAASGNSELGPTTAGGSVIITNGGTLDLENPTAQALSFTNTMDTAGKQFLIAGAGAGGNGAIVNNGTVNQQDAVQNLALTANATVGGPARWDLRVPDGKYHPVLDLRGFTLTKTGSNQMSLVSVLVTNGGNIVINQGIFSFETTSSNATTAITVNAGGVMGHYRENAGYFTAPITLNGGMIRDLNGTPGSTNDSPITLTANSLLDLNSNSVDQLRLNGVISESGGSFGLTKTNGGSFGGSFSLAGVNTYSGPTLVVQGALILAGNGSISLSKLINVSSNATFDASQRTDQTLTLASGQTLGGFGTVTGSVITVSGSTVAPGSVSNIGMLTFDNNVTLGGTNTMKVTHAAAATNDVLDVVNGSLGLGGTLNIALLGNSFAAGDSFKLYTAPGGLSGTFSATNLPALSGGLGWVTTNLVNGILSIVNAVNLNPTNITSSVSGSTLTLSWPADHTGWVLQVQTNSLAVGLNPSANAWSTVPGSSLVNTNIITMDPNRGTVFYRLAPPQ